MTVHVIGAGLAGLSAAVASIENGFEVHLHEAARLAGGRCRSYHDRHLHRTIDNGNHLLLSGNKGVYSFLKTIGATDGLIGPKKAIFPFIDVRTGERWEVSPDVTSVLDKRKRIPNTRLRDYSSVLRMAFARPSDTVHECVRNSGHLYERFWEPLGVGALNTDLAEGSAQILWSVMRETFLKGEKQCRPRVAKESLTDTFITPSLEWLRRQGAKLHFSNVLRHLVFAEDFAAGLDFGTDIIHLRKKDFVILAVPPWVASSLIPHLTVPDEYCAIVNAHYVLPAPLPPWIDPPLLGVVNGTAQWIFFRDEIATVTVSAANNLVMKTSSEIAQILWKDVAVALGMTHNTIPNYRIVKEKRATFKQTPQNECKRPGPCLPIPNVFLAGDWTNTQVPATIEGAIRSGQASVKALFQRLREIAP